MQLPILPNGKYDRLRVFFGQSRRGAVLNRVREKGNFLIPYTCRTCRRGKIRPYTILQYLHNTTMIAGDDSFLRDTPLIGRFREIAPVKTLDAFTIHPIKTQGRF